MKYLAHIRAHEYEINPSFERIIRSFFQERVTNYTIVHNDTEISLSVFLLEDLPIETRTELTNYFNIGLNVFELYPPQGTMHFDQIQDTPKFEKDIIGLYTTRNGTYPYVQRQRILYFLNPIENKTPILQLYHRAAITGYTLLQSTRYTKKTFYSDYFIDCYFDKLYKPVNPVNFIYELSQMHKPSYLNFDEFKYDQNTQHAFGLYNTNKDYKIVITFDAISNGNPYGNIIVMYYNLHPFRSKAYTKMRKEAFGEYFVELTRKDKNTPYVVRPYIDITNNMLVLEGINLHNPDYYSIFGCMLDRYDEKIIPSCFDIQSVKASYERFQSFETLYGIKTSQQFSA